MQDKILGAVFLGLSAASQAFIKPNDTAVFFSVIFFALGAYEFIQGEKQQRKNKN